MYRWTIHKIVQIWRVRTKRKVRFSGRSNYASLFHYVQRHHSVPASGRCNVEDPDLTPSQLDALSSFLSFKFHPLSILQCHIRAVPTSFSFYLLNLSFLSSPSPSVTSYLNYWKASLMSVFSLAFKLLWKLFFQNKSKWPTITTEHTHTHHLPICKCIEKIQSHC